MSRTTLSTAVPTVVGNHSAAASILDFENAGGAIVGTNKEANINSPGDAFVVWGTNDATIAAGAGAPPNCQNLGTLTAGSARPFVILASPLPVALVYQRITGTGAMDAILAGTGIPS